jgi:enterochelin esterase-like enzyme
VDQLPPLEIVRGPRHLSYSYQFPRGWSTGRTADYLSPAQIISRRFTINMLEVQSSKNEGNAMRKQARNHVNRKLSESDGAPAKPTGAVSGEFVTEMFEYDGGRQVTVYVPPDPPEAIVFAGDGQGISKWGRLIEKADVPSTMIVGVHGLTDETLRLHEYSPGFEPERFAAHEKFFVEDVRRWTESRFGVALPTQRTAVFGVSAGGELALALGLRHPQVYSAVLCASPGGGYKPPGIMPGPLPRTYLVAGTQEPFFLENARRWADALRGADADVVMNERAGSHGGAFWREEFPLMVAWAFGR